MRRHISSALASSSSSFAVVELTEKVEPGTGKFEVFVDGQLLHSMKNGDGHLSNYTDKLNNVVEKLKKMGY